MPEWNDNGIVLSVRKYGEKGLITNILTKNHGRHLGWITNYKNKNILSSVQPGNFVNVFWKARVLDQIGNYKVELISSTSGKIFDDKFKLQSLISLCSLLEKVLPERQCYNNIFHATEAFLSLLIIDDDLNAKKWMEGYVKWEIGVLSSIGFSLDLSKCAVTGSKYDLYFVSPKTGKAISKDAAGRFAPKLLLLPSFLGGAVVQLSSFHREILAGLNITSYFFENKLLLFSYNKDDSYLPNARKRFIQMIENSTF